MLTKKEIAAMRKDYRKHTLDIPDTALLPMDQFKKWFNEAITAKVDEANAMALATSTKAGKPSSRIVLLKGYDNEGITFFTNYDSKKGKEIAENPNAAILFFWKELERQIRIEGKIEKILKKDSQDYFNSRPKMSRIGAIASSQSSVLRSRQDLEDEVELLMKAFKDKEVIPLPTNWGGYKINPVYFEFWQGRKSRLHDRIVYEKKKGKWERYRIAP